MLFDQMLQQLLDEKKRVIDELEKVQKVIDSLEDLKSIQEGRGIPVFNLNVPPEDRIGQ